MIRLYLSERLQAQQTCRITGENHHYLTRVLRLKVGDSLHLFNGEHDANQRGIEWHAEIAHIDKNHLTLNIRDQQLGIAKPALDICLVQALSKGEKMDFSIQKAIELGASEIIVCASERSVLKLKNHEEREKKLARWQNIIINACQQSARCDVPNIRWSDHAFLELDQSAHAMGLLLNPTANCTIRTLDLATKQRVYLAIGAEGGWSPAEAAEAAANGWRSVALGARILRTETAGLAALAALQACWGDF